ncbi:DUF3461 family protein [Motiliproteus sp.]|uniref:DUF3461 family protein n=1 Tax=Motiliproteus sp. TaxID=1898955 RepID=UPI003BAC12AB
MTRYPTLSAMGVTDPKQIERYTLLPNANNETILKVYFNRPDESALPDSKKFVFRQTEGEERLQQALVELNQLARSPMSQQQIRLQLENELLQLEQVMQAKLGELRQRLQNWQ